MEKEPVCGCVCSVGVVSAHLPREEGSIKEIDNRLKRMDKHPDKTLWLSGGNAGRAVEAEKSNNCFQKLLFTISIFPAAKSQGSALMTYTCTDIKFIMAIMCRTLPLPLLL